MIQKIKCKEGNMNSRTVNTPSAIFMLWAIVALISSQRRPSLKMPFYLKTRFIFYLEEE